MGVDRRFPDPGLWSSSSSAFTITIVIWRKDLSLDSFGAPPAYSPQPRHRPHWWGASRHTVRRTFRPFTLDDVTAVYLAVEFHCRRREDTKQMEEVGATDSG